jgi:hypothetical protein
MQNTAPKKAVIFELSSTCTAMHSRKTILESIGKAEGLVRSGTENCSRACDWTTFSSCSSARALRPAQTVLAAAAVRHSGAVYPDYPLKLCAHHFSFPLSCDNRQFKTKLRLLKPWCYVELPLLKPT